MHIYALSSSHACHVRCYMRNATSYSILLLSFRANGPSTPLLTSADRGPLRCFSGTEQNSDRLNGSIGRSDHTEDDQSDVECFLSPCLRSSPQMQHGRINEAQWDTVLCTSTNVQLQVYVDTRLRVCSPCERSNETDETIQVGGSCP
jgi:hypothetical protein